MKSLILSLVLLFSIGCYDSEIYDSVEPYNTKVCEKHTDLCMDGGSDVYTICADEYGIWYVVYGVKYYTSDYMLMVECDIY